MEALQERKRKMSADIAELGKQVRRAKAKAKAAACTAARAWVLTGTVLRTVLIAYLLADGVPYPAVVFLKGKGRQFGWPDKTDEETEALIDTVFLAADPWEVVALASPGSMGLRLGTELAPRPSESPARRPARSPESSRWPRGASRLACEDGREVEGPCQWANAAARGRC